MRVTTQQTYVSMTQSFNNLSGSLAHVVEQMATGKEILQPSDDPIAATRITHGALLGQLQDAVSHEVVRRAHLPVTLVPPPLREVEADDLAALGGMEGLADDEPR